MVEILGIKLHLYGLIIALAVLSAWEVILHQEKDKEKKAITEKAGIFAIIGGVIGARIYHVVDFWGRYYQDNLLKVVYFWEGGLGIWGAIAGGMIALVIFAYFNKLKYFELLDKAALGLPLAQAIGRWGNLANNELWGKNGEPIFFYESILNFVLFLIIFAQQKNSKTGRNTGIYLLGYGLIRLTLEGWRPMGVIWKIYGLPTASLISGLAIMTGIILICRRRS